MTRPGERSRRGSRPTLRGREAECAALDQVIADARDGRSGVLVLRGDAGVGKTALLDHAVDSATKFRLLYVAGVESEMELAFAALHQLCAPLLDRVLGLPAPQRSALDTVFGKEAGAPPDRFLVGLAVLSLLSDASGEQPLLCVVDDAQWLDRASAQVLGFVARRLMAEPLAFLFGAREPAQELAGLPELEVTGLRDADARLLLAPVFRYVRDDRTRSRIVAEAHGNPLALLELPRGAAIDELAGREGPRTEQPLSRHLEDSFLARVEELPDEGRLLMLLAAADPIGDATLLWQAAQQLGIDLDTATGDAFKALLTIDDRVIFRHPLVRSAVYRSATMTDKRRAHLALSAVTDREVDPDRRAWHLASAAVGPDESVAEELERSADRAQARGGFAAAAAFLQRSVALTEEIPVRVGRALTAAQASLHAGDFDRALQMVSVAEAGATEEVQRVRALLLRGQIAFASGAWTDAPSILLTAGRRYEALDLDAARETYMTAWGAAVFAGEGAGPEVLKDICRAALALPPSPSGSRPVGLLLESLALLMVEGHGAAATKLREVGQVFAADDIPLSDVLQWGSAASGASNAVWDFHTSIAIARKHVAVLREVGGLGQLPVHLTALATAYAWVGEFAEAESLVLEAAAVAAATGIRLAPYAELRLRSLQGDEPAAAGLITTMVEQAAEEGQGLAATTAHWSAAVLHNGLAHYEAAAEAAARATSGAFEPWVSMWALPELIEASVRIGAAELAEDAMAQLATATENCETELANGVTLRSRALVMEGAAADACYAEAIVCLGRANARPELARAHLLYGEWLRRQGRRTDARAQLRSGYELFSAMGMEAFAERSRREMLATGETVRKRMAGANPSAELTAQERQIARLVGDGLSNPEVGARLFLSPRTVEWHLRKIFEKLSISSRKQLRDALPGSDLAVASG